MNALQIHAGQIQGQRRRQEDTFAIERFADGEALAGVADGLGGHPAGDVASREGLQEFFREFSRLRHGKGTPRHWLDESIHTAQRHLLKQQRDHGELFGMATTLVAIYAKGKGLWAASVGDSYLLRLRRGQLLLLNELHGENGGVTSAIGFNLARIDLSSHQLEPGDRYLVATDGIVTLDDDELGRVLGAAPDAAAAVHALLAAVEKHAHPHQDNVTAVVLFA
jgi:protein phosphatase